jgi:DNA (cytosine-5)-methyltransferase 1
MWMLKPKDLYAGQGFPNNYIIDKDDRCKPYQIKEQVERN